MAAAPVFAAGLLPAAFAHSFPAFLIATGVVGLGQGVYLNVDIALVTQPDPAKLPPSAGFRAVPPPQPRSRVRGPPSPDCAFARCRHPALRTIVGSTTKGADVRGDWIHDWVLVEMDYRAGPQPGPAVRERPPSKPWKTLWTALFPARRAGVPHP